MYLKEVEILIWILNIMGYIIRVDDLDRFVFFYRLIKYVKGVVVGFCGF